MSRVFISHSSHDNAWAIAVKQWLAEQQPDLAREIFLDIDPQTGIHSGQRWKDALRDAKERCEAVVCLVSRNWLGSRECEAEYRAAEYFGKRIYSARIEPLDGATDLTREWQGCDLHGDGPHTEIRIGSHPKPVQMHTAGLQQLLTGLRAAGIGTDHFPWPPPEAPDRAPYRGWEPFEAADAAVFFGRDAQILRAVDTLRAMRTDGTTPLFVVVGASGTGKSSFLRAGLIPRLTRDDRHFAVLDTMRPERAALTGTHGLAAAIHTTRRRLGLPVPELGDIKTALVRHNSVLLRQWLVDIQQTAQTRLVDAGTGAPTLVLPIDQAEELLTADAGPEGPQTLEQLADLLTEPVGQRLALIVAVTIRTDRYEHLQSAPQLSGVDTVVFDDLKPMPHDRFREIITGPARRSPDHLEVAPDLVDQLLADCGDGADTLPLLSLTLATLYRDYGASGALTRDQYLTRHGIDNVVATEIDTLLSRAPETRAHELTLLRSAFIPLLATIGPNSDQPLRRIAAWSDLPADARPLIDRFVNRRLLVKDHRKTSDGSDEQTVVEVALESLLRQWSDLAGWLREEADDLRTAENLERAADDWNHNDRGTAWLLTGPRLITAETLVDRPGYRERLAAARDYLTASRRHEDTRRADELLEAKAHADSLRRRARTLIALATVAVLVAATAVFYYVRANTAELHATDLAEASIAASLVQDAQQQFTNGHDVRRGVLETLAAHALSPTTTKTALLAAQYQTQNITKIADIRPLRVAASPDGRWVVTCEHLGVVRIWDTTSQTGPRLLPGAGTDAVGTVSVTPDGRWAIAGDHAGVVRVWDTTSEAGPRLLPGTGDDAVFIVAVSPDGRWVIAGDHAGVVRVWDTTSEAGPRQLPGTGKSTATAVAVSPDGHWAVTGDAVGVVRVWDTTSESEPRVPPSTSPIGAGAVRGDGLTGADLVDAVTVSPDGRWIVTADAVGVVRVWDTTSEAEPTLLPGTASGTTHATSVPVHALAASPDGRWIVAGDNNGVIRVWDTTSGGVPRFLLGAGTSPVWAVAVSADGRWIVTGDTAPAVRVWDTTSGTGPRLLPGTGTSPVGPVAVTPSGRWIVTGDSTGVVRVWDTTSEAAGPRSLPGSGNSPVYAVVVGPDGRWVIASDSTGVVRMWDTTSGTGPRLLPGTGTSQVYTVAVNSDGRWVIAGDGSGVVRMWDTTSETGPRLLPRTGTSQVFAVAVSPDRRWVIAGDGSGVVRMWDTTSETGPRLLPGTGTSRFTEVAVSPDGRWAIAGDASGAVWVWDTLSGSGSRSLPGTGTSSVSAVAVSPDGHWVTAGDNAGAVKIWSTDPNQIGVAAANYFVPAVGNLVFDAQGRSIYAISQLGTFAVIPFQTPDPKQLCSKLTTTISTTEWEKWVSPDLPPMRLCDGLRPPSDG